MLNGTFYNPTKILFGRGMEEKVGEEVAGFKVLLHYGGGSIKRNGLYDKVTKSLTNIVELGGVKPNPRADLVYEGIELCRRENIDFILAVGGGSVIDSAKAIVRYVVLPRKVLMSLLRCALMMESLRKVFLWIGVTLFMLKL